MSEALAHCARCGFQPASSFTKNKRRKNGLDQYCKECKRLSRQTEKLNPEKRIERQRRYYRRLASSPDKAEQLKRVRVRTRTYQDVRQASSVEYRERAKERARCSYHKASCEHHRALDRRWRAENPEADYRNGRASHLRRTYGISLEEYEAMAESQGFVCAICHKPNHSKKGQLHVDHSHSTGAIRGLLCFGCNNGLGAFKDNPELLLAAINYLQRYF
jgi:hypothetical protein